MEDQRKVALSLAHHHTHDLIARGLVGFAFPGVFAAAKHDDAICDFKNVAQIVRDEVTPLPAALRERINAMTLSCSGTAKAAVGSSMMTRRAFQKIARPMATACRWPPGQSPVTPSSSQTAGRRIIREDSVDSREYEVLGRAFR
jgi:hypothetical protein